MPIIENVKAYKQGKSDGRETVREFRADPKLVETWFGPDTLEPHEYLLSTLTKSALAKALGISRFSEDRRNELFVQACDSYNHGFKFGARDEARRTWRGASNVTRGHYIHHGCEHPHGSLRALARCAFVKGGILRSAYVYADGTKRQLTKSELDKALNLMPCKRQRG